MIIPENRLLWAFGSVVLPMTLVWAVFSLGPVYLAVPVFILVVLGITDAAYSLKLLKDIEIDLPERLRLTRNEKSALDFTVTDRGGKNPTLVIGLALPETIESPMPSYEIKMPEGKNALRISWPLVGSRRGFYLLKQLSVRTVSTMGFWSRQAVFPCNVEIHVYPNLLRERRKLAALFLNRGGYGSHAQRPMGKGREFEKLREYVRGDSLSDIHWKATAKRGHPVTKEYQIERTQEIYIVVDASRLSGRAGKYLSPEGGTEDPLLEHFIVSAHMLGMVAQRQGDLCGLVTFSDRILTFLRARSGSAHFRVFRDALYNLHPHPSNPDFDEISTFINLRLRRRALIFMLTSLDDPALAESFERDMEIVNRRHLIMVNSIKPAAANPVFSGAGVPDTDSIYEKLAGHLLWQELQELRVRLHRKGMDFHMLKSESMSAELVSQYMRVKARQLL
jgi:uncharacterized protein (DUF58 family)